MKKIFILHGWAYSTDKWNDLIRLMGQHGYEPILLTIPGLTEKTDRVWTLDDYVEWLNGRLDHEEKPILIGHSNGGRISIAYAAKYRTKLDHLILICSAGIYHNELRIRMKRFIFGTMAKLGKKFTSSTLLRNFLYKLARENDYKDATPQMRQTMNNLITVDLTNKLPLISTSTLIIWGEDDRITPLSDAEIMHKMIKNSKLCVIKNARHAPYFTNANEVATKIFDEIKI